MTRVANSNGKGTSGTEKFSRQTCVFVPLSTTCNHQLTTHHSCSFAWRQKNITTLVACAFLSHCLPPSITNPLRTTLVALPGGRKHHHSCDCPRKNLIPVFLPHNVYHHPQPTHQSCGFAWGQDTSPFFDRPISKTNLCFCPTVYHYPLTAPMALLGEQKGVRACLLLHLRPCCDLVFGRGTICVRMRVRVCACAKVA